MEEKRIYVVVPEIVFATTRVVQPKGRQFAQGIHAVNELRRYLYYSLKMNPVAAFAIRTTITLQARDSKELDHVAYLLVRRKLTPVCFQDENDEYGPGCYATALAVLATPKQVDGILGYLPLWS